MKKFEYQLIHAEILEIINLLVRNNIVLFKLTGTNVPEKVRFVPILSQL